MGYETPRKGSVGDAIEDAWLGSYGIHTGGEANRLALEERRRQEQEIRRQHQDLVARRTSVAAGGGQPAGSSKSLEEWLAGLVGVALWAVLSYYGITELGLPWYWPVGIGLVVAVVTCKLLLGPLYFVLTVTKWLFCLGMLAFMVCVILTIMGY